MSLIFIESGTSATGDFKFYDIADTNVTSVTTPTLIGAARCIKTSTGDPAGTNTFGKYNILADTGRRFHFVLRFEVLPAADTVFLAVRTSGDAGCWGLMLRTNGTIAFVNGAGTITTNGAGTTVLATETVHSICISYTVTNGTTNAFKIYVNHNIELNITNQSITAASSRV
jgi:hypothetical protein